MSDTVTIRPEFRSPERIKADEELANHFEQFIVVDASNGWYIHSAEDERRKLAEMNAANANNAIAQGGMEAPFLWNGKAYRVVRAAYSNGLASVEVVPKDSALETELRRRIESAPHHVLTFYQGFGFICFAEDHARYQDFRPRHG
jgi:hypothetical protein